MLDSEHEDQHTMLNELALILAEAQLRRSGYDGSELFGIILQLREIVEKQEAE